MGIHNHGFFHQQEMTWIFFTNLHVGSMKVMALEGPPIPVEISGMNRPSLVINQAWHGSCCAPMFGSQTWFHQIYGNPL